MRRVVITGMGIVSCIGLDVQAVNKSLMAGQSGIRYNETFAEMGLRCNISAYIDRDAVRAQIDRKIDRFMGDAARYAYVSMLQAIDDAKLTHDDISNPRTGLIASSGGAGVESLISAADLLRSKGVRRLGPYRVTQAMSSSVSACLATPFQIKGVSYSVTSACTTSLHCIGSAIEQIQLGKQDIVFAGGGEEEHWGLSSLFDAMGALSSKYNDNPTTASRPYDQNRDGFVPSSGGGMLVVEELEHARARNARIYAEVTGYMATSDGKDMVQPSGDGAVRAMQGALPKNAQIDYINTHGTSTPAGDITELRAIGEVFADKLPLISSTKSLTGHSLGATGVHEAIFTLLMMQDSYVSPTINIETLDPDAAGYPIVTEYTKTPIEHAMTNSFGFGGTNASMVFSQYKDS